MQTPRRKTSAWIWISAFSLWGWCANHYTTMQHYKTIILIILFSVEENKTKAHTVKKCSCILMPESTISIQITTIKVKKKKARSPWRIACSGAHCFILGKSKRARIWTCLFLWTLTSLYVYPQMAHWSCLVVYVYWKNTKLLSSFYIKDFYMLLLGH